MLKQYIDKIGESKDTSKMERLGDMLEELIYDLKESHPDIYEGYKQELYELAYGKKLTKEMAKEWVSEMKPVGEHWTMEQTTNAMTGLGYNFEGVDFYVVSNMMYNDYNDLVVENEELALRLAKDWLNDEDAKDDKLYCYWKNIVKR
ncbi:MAG: hypothetical protein J6T15_03655 [Bacilli bacterium]|nr:hypothetical protein [Bacilli bacterium]